MAYGLSLRLTTYGLRLTAYNLRLTAHGIGAVFPEIIRIEEDLMNARSEGRCTLSLTTCIDSVRLITRSSILFYTWPFCLCEYNHLHFKCYIVITAKCRDKIDVTIVRRYCCLFCFSVLRLE